MTVFYYLAGVALLGVLVMFHEYGHYLAARLLGVHVRVFSIGFGSRVVGFVYKGTDYRLSSVPLGGYVRMAGADPFAEGGSDDGEEPVPDEQSFIHKSVWARLIITLAGPAANLVLPVLVFTVLFRVGEPQELAEVGAVLVGLPAQESGIKPEDRLVEVNGVAVRTWVDVQDELDSKPIGDEVPVVVDRAGVKTPIVIDVRELRARGEVSARDLGFRIGSPDTSVVIDHPGSPAALAGLRTGDRLTVIGDQPVRSWNQVARLLGSASGPVEIRWTRDISEGPHDPLPIDAGATLVPNPGFAEPSAADDGVWRSFGLSTASVSVGGFADDSAAKAAGLPDNARLLQVDDRPIRSWTDVTVAVAASASGEGDSQTTRSLTLVYRSEGVVSTLTLVPPVVQDVDEIGRYRWRPLLGIQRAGSDVLPERVERAYPIGESAVRATLRTHEIAMGTIVRVGELLTFKAAFERSIGGPVEMIRQTRDAAKRGLFDWAGMLAILSIGVGVFNLLPIPVLDGGQAMLYIAEAVRGRPLPLILRERAQQAGIVFIMLLVLVVFALDIHRAVTG